MKVLIELSDDEVHALIDYHQREEEQAVRKQEYIDADACKKRVAELYGHIGETRDKNR
jgi:hypothetical protein